MDLKRTYWYSKGGWYFSGDLIFNPFIPEITIVIFIHNKPRIAVAILDL